MKVRIGIGAGRQVLSTGDFHGLIDAIEHLAFDSLWMSEVLTSPGFDPLVGLSFAAAYSAQLKLGTTMLLPGRNLLRLAKMLSSLDVLSGGRVLVTFVPGLTRGPERNAIGSDVARRGGEIDDTLPALRALLEGEPVSHVGPLARLDEVVLEPLPVQQPMEFWLGGIAETSLERCGRLGDGWLPSLCTPQEARAGREVIERVAKEHGRAISSEHFGMSIAYARTSTDPALVETLPARARTHEIGELVPVGGEAIRKLIEEFLDEGFSKFVLRPVETPQSWHDELTELAQSVGDLQT